MRDLGTGSPVQAPEASEWRDAPVTALRKTFVAFLQALYGFSERGEFLWTPGSDSEIFITDENPIRLKDVGQRPAINTVRGPMSWANLTIGGQQSVPMPGRQKKFTDLVSTTMSINHCSRNDLESEQLAWVTANHFWMLAEILTKEPMIHRIAPPSIGSPSPAGAIVQGDTEGEWFNTSVAIPTFLQVYGSVTTKNQHHMLREIRLRVDQIRTTPEFTQVREMTANNAIMPPRFPPRTPARPGLTGLDITIKVKE